MPPRKSVASAAKAKAKEPRAKEPKAKEPKAKEPKVHRKRAAEAPAAADKPRKSRKDAAAGSASSASAARAPAPAAPSKSSGKKMRTVSSAAQKTWRPLSSGARRFVIRLLRDAAAVVVAGARETRQPLVLDHLNRCIAEIEARLATAPVPPTSLQFGAGDDRRRLFNLTRTAEAGLLDDLRQSAFLESALAAAEEELARVTAAADEAERLLEGERQSGAAADGGDGDRSGRAEHDDVTVEAPFYTSSAATASMDRSLRTAVAAVSEQLGAVAAGADEHKSADEEIHSLQRRLIEVAKQMGLEESIVAAALGNMQR